MTKIGITTVFLCCLVTTIASAGDSYLCVANMATGFAYNKTLDKWDVANFNVDDKKYVVTRSKRENFAWEVKQIGRNIPVSWCKKDINEVGLLHCEGFQYFKMNINNLRFMSVYMVGYIHYNIKDDNGNIMFKEGENTPSMEIGKCSPLP